MRRRDALREVSHQVDICVVGGGMAGLLASVAAARHGAQVVLVQDRPVLGGNASSECRMHVCGADRHNQIPNMRETGLLEEIRLDNLRRNRQRSYSVWDTVLYEKALLEPNITLLLNTSCLDAKVYGGTIASVRAWQLTTQTFHSITARIFIDCSGDAILAPLTGAEHRMGREARSEFGESIAPEVADERTMGMTCLFHARRHDAPQPFEPLPWAYTFETDGEIPYGAGGHRWLEMGYWWVELGGEHHSIHDTEMLRDELLKIVYGLWDHIKNRGDHGAENWALDWVQFLPAKRESVRYVGDRILTQLDIEAEGRFGDIVAYGGWSMDDHHPAGFRSAKLGAKSTVFHPAPSPYGIPYRTLYSRNVANLMFAGRCASCTHAAMSSTRVMGTASVQGQAAGTAAALAIAKGILPRDVNSHIDELQQTLLRDDCYLPWVPQRFGQLTQSARLSASEGDPEPVRDGVNRPVGDDTHAWECGPGAWIAYGFAGKRDVSQVTLVLDSALAKNIQLSYHQPDDQLTAPPPEMPRAFRLEVLRDGRWTPLCTIGDNHQRLVRLMGAPAAEGVRWILDETWGAEKTRVYAFTVDEGRVA